MKKTRSIHGILLASMLFLGHGALAAEPPKMPYLFEMNCYMCHRVPDQTGPSSIFDMKSKDGNPFNGQYVRSNARFGLNAMPAFRISEIDEKGLEDIVRYLETLAIYRQEHPGYEPKPADAEGGQ